MSEEERIKNDLKRFKKEILENKPARVTLSSNFLLETIEMLDKQQKEIKELKDITRAYDGMQGIMPEGHPIVIADKEYFDSGRFTEKYISKDKIREKIKELEEKSKDSVNNAYDYGIYFLQELLGDEDVKI
jgi:urocanate hydratase